MAFDISQIMTIIFAHIVCARRAPLPSRLTFVCVFVGIWENHSDYIIPGTGYIHMNARKETRLKLKLNCEAFFFLLFNRFGLWQLFNKNCSFLKEASCPFRVFMCWPLTCNLFHTVPSIFVHIRCLSLVTQDSSKFVVIDFNFFLFAIFCALSSKIWAAQNFL